MPSPDLQRRNLLKFAAGAGLATLNPLAAASAAESAAAANRPTENRHMTLGPPRHVRTDLLDVAYHEAGPANGQPVLLLHGFPYDVHSYVDVASMLANQGYRVIVPHLRGHGATRFLDAATPRSGQQAALGADTVAFMDALKIDRAVLAGYDWGGRAACVVAALWPERCIGLVSVNSYLIQDIANAAKPLPARVERGFWYQFYFLTERGRAGLTANRRDIVRIMWHDNSPGWQFDDATFERSAAAFDNPDYVDVVIHSYRHRLGAADGYPQYAELEKKLAALPVIKVPTVTLDGKADGVVPATDGTASAAKFTSSRRHLQVPNAGHNLPQEAPQVFADAVVEVLKAGTRA
jgi:pimeloyl-ACP methyl ester carboxylesterase